MIGLNPSEPNAQVPSLLCDECGTGFTLDEYDDRHADDFTETHADCCTGGGEDGDACNTESEAVATRRRRQAAAQAERRKEERRKDYDLWRTNERRKADRRTR